MAATLNKTTTLGQEPRRVLITGAATGIGAAIATKFTDDGDRAHICDINSAAVDTFCNENPSITATVTDLSDRADINQLFKEVDSTLGGLDVLINCAGVKGPVAPAQEISFDDWRACLSVNLDAIFLCSTLAYERMAPAKSGSIVNISSTYALTAGKNRSPYITAKCAVNGLTKALACDFAADSIRVNAVAPGPVEGPRLEKVMEEEAKAEGISYQQAREEMEACTALPGLCKPEEIAEAVHWLSSKAAYRITGQLLSVDGFSLS